MNKKKESSCNNYNLIKIPHFFKKISKLKKIFMDPNKKSAADLDKSNTIIKIKLSDMLVGSQKPIDEEPIFSDTDSNVLDEDEDEDQEIINDPANSGSPEDLSSLQSPLDPDSRFPPEEESVSNNSQINVKPPSLSDPKAISDMGVTSNNDELLEKSPVKMETETEIDRRELEKSDTFMEIKEKTSNPLKDSSIDPSQSQQGNYWKYRKPTKHKHNNVLVDYTSLRMNQDDIFQVSLERASNFNDYVLNNRKRIKEITKSLERQKLSQRFALDNSNSVFPSLLIPLIRHDEDSGEPAFDNNGCLELEKDSVQKFIELNVTNEHSTFEHPSKFAMFYPRRFQRRRRRRRNASKYLNNNPNNEQNPDSGNKLSPR